MEARARDEAVIITFIWHIIHTVETQGRERSHQSPRGEQYDDDPDREDGNREKRQKTRPYQEGKLMSDSDPRSLTEEHDIRRQKPTEPSPKLEIPPGITVKNVLKGTSAVVLVILILLVTFAVAIFYCTRTKEIAS